MISLERAIVHDAECWPNYFSLYAEELNSDASALFVIAPWRDDRRLLMQWFNGLSSSVSPMIGFNSVGYDYEMYHAIWKNPHITNAELYALSKSIVNRPFGAPQRTVYPNERFATQIDLFKICHFDNKAKSTSLKALEINMRSRLVLESKLSFDEPITEFQAETIAIPYNVHDVRETKRFAQFNREPMEFRIGMSDRLNGDVMNFNDTKIGEKLLESRLGEAVCYQFVPKYPGDNNPKRVPRQTIRNRIALKDIIFPYIVFQNSEFQRVHQWMLQQVLTPDDLDDPDAEIKTKGVFTGVVANVGGVEFKFGTGGIHASVLNKRFVADDEWLIRDIDVASLYPSIAIVNRLAPAHLGQAFVEEYAKLPSERKEWQAKKGKKCAEANSMKLAGNGAYGKSNSKFSFLYDPQFTMQITINGQLLLCMLAEWLLTVPTISLVQVNTDGITYRIHASQLDAAKEIEKTWQSYTSLTLEDAAYSHMFIRDCNSYIAQNAKDGTYKLKGAYWTPGIGEDYAKSISEAQPPAWHKNLSNIVSIKAAVAAMTQGIPVEQYIRFHADPFDFVSRVKVKRSDDLFLNGVEIQRTSRYYVAVNGYDLIKRSPPAKDYVIGNYCKKNGVSEHEYNSIMATLPPNTHDERIHTKNKSRYKMREDNVEAGWKVCECNDMNDFRFDNINWNYYVSEANKLLIS